MRKRFSEVPHTPLALTVWACTLATLAVFATLGGRAADVSDHSPITSDSSAVQVPPEQVRREMAMHGSPAIAPFVGSALTSEFGILHTTLEVLNSAEEAVQFTFTFRDAHGQPLPMPVEQPACASCSAWQSTGQGTVGPNGKATIVVIPGDPFSAGWAEFEWDPGVSIRVVATVHAKTADGTVSRIEIPSMSLHRQAWIQSDNSSGRMTTLVLTNPDSQARTFGVAHRPVSSAGSTCETSVQVAPKGLALVNTADTLQCSNGQLGLLEVTGEGEFTGIAIIRHENGSISGSQFSKTATAALVQAPLQEWTVSPGMVRYGVLGSVGCVAVRNRSVNGARHTVHSSKWQRRADESAEWTDIADTSREGMVCAFTPPPGESGQYRGVAEITIDGKRGLYAARSILTVRSPPLPSGPFEMDRANRHPEGLAFGADKLFIVDRSDDKVYAYLPSGQRDSASDFDLARDNGEPMGIAFSNGRLFVVDQSDDKVYAYFASGQRDSASDFDLTRGNDEPRGIAFGDSRFFVLDRADDTVYVYLASGQHSPASDFDLESGNQDPMGIAFGDGRLFVADRSDAKLYAYLASGLRNPASDLDYNLDSGNRLPRRIAFGDGRLFVVDSRLGRMQLWAYLPWIQEDSAAGGQYERLDAWRVSEGSVQFSSLPEGDCFGPDIVDGATYTVHASNWQTRPDESGTWADVPGTNRPGEICSFAPTAPGQYRGVADLSVNGKRGWYKSGNSLTAATVEGADDEALLYLSGDNRQPRGIAARDGRLFVVDRVYGKVYAYLTSGPRDPESDFDLDPDNAARTGIAVANGRFFVTDWDDKKVYSYLPSGRRDVDSEFALTEGNSEPRGIAFANGKFYVADARRAYAYVASGEPDSSFDFSYGSAVGSASGIGFGDGKFYVVDSLGENVRAYLASGERDPGSDFDLVKEGGYPQGITVVGDRVFVVDFDHESVYLYLSSGEVVVGAGQSTKRGVVGDAFYLSDNNASASGIAFGHGKAWVIDVVAAKAFAYPESGRQTSSDDLNLGLTYPHAATFVDDDLLVIDGNGVFGYRHAPNTTVEVVVERGRRTDHTVDFLRDPSSDFSLDVENADPVGMAFGDGRIYVVDSADRSVYAYLPSGLRDPDSDFQLVMGNGNPAGMAFGDGRIYVVDSADRSVYAYLTSGLRDPDSDFILRSDNNDPLAVAYGNGKLFVLNGSDYRVYAYWISRLVVTVTEGS